MKGIAEGAGVLLLLTFTAMAIYYSTTVSNVKLKTEIVAGKEATESLKRELDFAAYQRDMDHQQRTFVTSDGIAYTGTTSFLENAQQIVHDGDLNEMKCKEILSERKSQQDLRLTLGTLSTEDQLAELNASLERGKAHARHATNIYGATEVTNRIVLEGAVKQSNSAVRAVAHAVDAGGSMVRSAAATRSEQNRQKAENEAQARKQRAREEAFAKREAEERRPWYKKLFGIRD